MYCSIFNSCKTTNAMQLHLVFSCMKNGDWYKTPSFNCAFILGTASKTQITVRILIIVQRDSSQSSLFIILQVHSTCCGCQPHPSSGVHKTVTTASGTGQLLCGYLPPTWPSLATLAGGSCTKIWPVPEVVVTVLCIPDDGCGWPRWREVAAQKYDQYRRL